MGPVSKNARYLTGRRRKARQRFDNADGRGREGSQRGREKMTGSEKTEGEDG